MVRPRVSRVSRGEMRTWRRGVFVFACVLTTSSCLAGARAATELRASLEEEGERNAFVALGTGGADDVADGTITSAWRRRHRQLGGDNSGPTDPGGDDGGDSGVPVPSPTLRPTAWPTPKPSTSAPSSTFAPTATFAPSWAPTLSRAPSLFYPTGLPVPKPSAAVDDVIDDDSLRPMDLPTSKPTTLAPSLSPLPSLAPTFSVAPTLSVRPTPKPSHTRGRTRAPLDRDAGDLNCSENKPCALNTHDTKQAPRPRRETGERGNGHTRGHADDFRPALGAKDKNSIKPQAMELKARARKRQLGRPP